MKHEINIPDSRPSIAAPGVIWITGFSAAGKSTVARKVKVLLQESGASVVLLDGDDLRRIFSDRWGYSRTERIELAHAYFRLCNSLAAQGITVIIAAVAMYTEIFKWVRDNIDHSMQVYLRVPEQERVSRDSATKKVYASIGDATKLYDEPQSADLVIDNYGSTSPDAAASAIVAAYRSLRRVTSNKGRSEHWNSFYKSAPVPLEPSSFALAVGKELKEPPKRLLEVGCGNGRDAIHFAKAGHFVTAIDTSSAAIELCNARHSSLGISFLKCALPDLATPPDPFDAVYSRFCLHAMTEVEEIDMLRAAYRVLRPKGRLYIECRSINDPLSRKGEVISPTERIFGHYRRFIVLDELKGRLANAGFTLLSSHEADNLAVHGDDNPVVLRVTAVK